MSFAARCARITLHCYAIIRGPHPPSCRYIPSCSEYAMESIETHGFVRGGALMLKRLVRCAPWGGWGVDPVPNSKNENHLRLQ